MCRLRNHNPWYSVQSQKLARVSYPTKSVGSKVGISQSTIDTDERLFESLMFVGCRLKILIGIMRLAVRAIPLAPLYSYPETLE